MKKRKRIQSVIAIFLVIVTVFSSVSVSAGPLSDAVKALQSETEEAVSEAAEVLCEETELRGENIKQFRMSDGTIQAAQYTAPVHFEQNGEWVDYDNTLTEVDADEEENTGKSAKNKDLTNRTADYRVRLSKKTNGKKFVRVEKDGYKLSWYYDGAKKSTAKVSESREDGDPATLEKLTSTVLYENVYKSTDFEYIIGSDGIKENILLQGKNAPAEFTAVYKANGLTPVQTDDKTIEMRAEDGTVVYVITAPYMEAADGDCSDGVSLSLAGIKNNTFTVITTLDNEWLQAEVREYPVTVDPMLKTKQTPSGVQSAFVSSDNPNTCYKAAGTDDMGSLYVGNIYGFGKTESYIKFTSLPALSIADKVVDARLYIGLRKCEVGLPVNVKRLVDDWNEKTVTWNNGPYSESDIADYMMLTEKTDLTKFREVEITDMVRGWYSGEYPNYGLSLTTTKTAAAKAWFYSINYTTYPQNRPLMTVSYRNMSGYEDYWSYTDLSAGRGGAASVNNYNGNFTFSQPVTQDNGGTLMPVNISLIYNSNKGDAKYGFIGSHFQTNYQMYLVKTGGEYWDNGYKYYLNDADGTIHYFYFENGSNTVGKDEDGLGYTLNVISVGSDGIEKDANYVITDKDENKMYFDNAGRLLRIKNPSDISVTVQYNNNNQISLIKDGAGREYRYVYSTNNAKYLAHIEDPAGRKTQFTYSGDYLSKITFADGAAVQLSYSGGLLSEIKGIDGTRTKVSYDSSAQKRVTAVNWGASDSEQLEKYSFAYKQNETSVTDLQNRSYTFQFNDFGQTTGTVSNTDGSAQYFELNKGNDTSSKANKLISESRVFQSTTNYVENPGFTRGFESYWAYINNTSGASVTVDSSKKNITNSSVKVTKSASNTGRVNAVQTINNLPAGTYTLSAYIYTDGKTIPGAGVQMFPEVRDANDNLICNANIEKTTITNGWERRTVTFDVPANASVKATMGFGPDAYGTVWFDDIQLEKSAGTSSYNLIENSAFNNGMTGWTTLSTDSSTVANAGLSGFDKCGKLTGTVENKNKILRQYVQVAGKKGDVFSYGMWAYASSVPLNDTKTEDGYNPRFEIGLDYYDASGKWLGNKSKSFNADVKNAWQFLTDHVILPSDCGIIAVSLNCSNNANNAYLTGAFCYKEQYGQTYDYDKDGNVTSVVDIAKTNSTFSYYGNQMKKMINPSGSKYYYTYNDNKQLRVALSNDGFEYGFNYDDKGNVTKASVTGRKPVKQVENGKSYVLVNAYSGLDINSGWQGNSGDEIKTWHYDAYTPTHQWRAELVSGTADVYKLKAMNFADQYMDVTSGSSAAGAEIQIYKSADVKAQQFKFVKNADGSFSILTASSNYTKCLDGQYDSTEIIMSRVVKQSEYNKDKLKDSQKWLLYPAGASEEKSIVTETAYTESKNFVSTSTDQRGNVTSYAYDEAKGTLNSVTDAGDNTTEYTYDANNDSLLSVSSSGVTNSYAYDKDRLERIDVNGALQYSFGYDKYGRNTVNRVGNGTAWKTLSEVQYNSAGLMTKQTYGNEDYVDFTYDKLDRLTEKRYNNNSSQRVTYSYGNNGSVAQTTDYYTNTNTRFVYDLAERVVSQREYSGTAKNGGTLLSYTDFTYADKTNYLTGIKHYSPLGTQTIGYRYGNAGTGYMPDQVYAVSWNGEEKVKYSYDGLGRPAYRLTGASLSKYIYEDVGEDRTTTLVKAVETAAGTYTYTYDSLGNILSVTDGTYTTSYGYDSLNQLTRVNDEKAGKTYTYSYTNGNISDRTEYAYTTEELGESTGTKSWTYGDSTWADLLTNYNGTAITYDEIGNPLTMGDKELTWLGRQLQSITEGENTISYAYNGDGQRVSKTVNGTKTEYYYNGSILAGQKSGEDTLVFMYDNNSDIFGFIYNGTEYYYIKNAQNDVIAIADAGGNIIANYYYDAWGKLVEATGNTEIANLNPIRYRSYYYDSETEWYYLNTRYYSADMCRFINGDGYIQTGQGVLDKNMFAYCLNNPVNLLDKNGEIAGWIIALIVISACTVIGGIAGYIISRKTNKNLYQQAFSNSNNNNASNSNNNKTSNSTKNKTSNSKNSSASSKKANNNSKKQGSGKSTYEVEEKLKPQEIAMNVFIGATIGLAIGGALVMSGGALAAVIGNFAAAGGAVTICGTSTLAVINGGQQVAAIGILAYNLEAMVFGPFYFAELEPIEWSND